MENLVSELFGGRSRSKGINGKRKGNDNERKVAKVLKMWTGADFVRTPQSGALRWNDTDKIASDVICDTPGFNFPFVVETKALKSLKFSPILRQGSGVFKIWEQVMFDANRAQKIPLALLRPDGMESFKVDRCKFQDYYLVLLYRFGGKQVRRYGVPVAFKGKCDKRGFDLIGFTLKDVIERLPYVLFTEALRIDDTLSTFIKTHNQYYTWTH